MADLWRDFRILLRVAWLTELEYRANFLISLVGAVAYNAGQLLFIGVLLHAFGSIAGWNAAHVMVLFGIRMASHSVYAFFFRRMIDLDQVVRTGEFDRYLLRPTSPFLQLLMRRFNLQQFGDVIIAAVILAFALPAAEIDWSVGLTLWLLAAIGAGGMLEAGLQLARGSLAFRWRNTESISGLIETVFGTELSAAGLRRRGRGAVHRLGAAGVRRLDPGGDGDRPGRLALVPRAAGLAESGRRRARVRDGRDLLQPAVTALLEPWILNSRERGDGVVMPNRVVGRMTSVTADPWMTHTSR